MNIKLLSDIRDLMLKAHEQGDALTYGKTHVPVNLNDWLVHNDCGFAACAIGHAILAGLLPSIELHFYTPPMLVSPSVACGEELENVAPLMEQRRRKYPTTTNVSSMRHSGEGGFVGVEYLAQVLDVSTDDVCWLFTPCAYSPKTATALDVANRIDDLIHGRVGL